jgi:hypothetical protein
MMNPNDDYDNVSGSQDQAFDFQPTFTFTNSPRKYGPRCNTQLEACQYWFAGTLVAIALGHLIVHAWLAVATHDASLLVAAKGKHLVSMTTRALAETEKFEQLILCSAALATLMASSAFLVFVRPHLVGIIAVCGLAGIGMLSVMLPVVTFHVAGAVYLLGILVELGTLLCQWIRLGLIVRAYNSSAARGEP